jgi:hypothetical protein
MRLIERWALDPPKRRLKLSGAAILVFGASTFLQAGPAD